MAPERTNLLPGERVVMESDRGLLTLTNLRVRLDASTGGASLYTTITLDAVAASGVITRSHPMLFALAVIAAIFGVTQRGDERVSLLVLAGVLAVAYAVTRRAFLTICSNGGEAIRVPAHAMGRAAIVEFVDALDEAKVNFLAGHRQSQEHVVDGGIRR